MTSVPQPEFPFPLQGEFHANSQNDFLDSLDKCTQCWLDNRGMTTTDANDYTDVLTGFRQTCIQKGYKVGNVSTGNQISTDQTTTAGQTSATDKPSTKGTGSGALALREVGTDGSEALQMMHWNQTTGAETHTLSPAWLPPFSFRPSSSLPCLPPFSKSNCWPLAPQRQHGPMFVVSWSRDRRRRGACIRHRSS